MEPDEFEGVGTPVTEEEEPSWVVRLHPGSGHVFWEQPDTAATTWSNPLEPNSLVDLLDAESELMEAEQLQEAVEELAGFAKAPDRGVFSHPEALAANEAFLRWLSGRGIRVDAGDVGLRWPEYVDVRRPAPTAQVISFQMRLPDGYASPGIDRRVFRLPLGATVREVIETCFVKFKRVDPSLEQRDLAPERFVLKVEGYCDYLLHQEFPVYLFDCVQHALRQQSAVKLNLVELSEADADDLSPLMRLPLDEHLQQLADNCEPSDIDQDPPPEDAEDTAEMSLVARLGSALHLGSPLAAVGEGAAASAEEQELPLSSAGDGEGGEGEEKEASSSDDLPFESLHWPFRLRLHGIEGCPTDLEFHSLVVRTTLYVNGEIAAPNANGSVMLSARGDASCVLETPPTPHTAEPRWAAEWLTSNKYVIAQLPPTTRIAFEVLGVSAQGVRTSLAGVALTLVDWQFRLRTGMQALRLWPSPQLQLARDPQLGKGENAPRPLSLAAGTVVDNVLANAGVLRFEMDEYDIPVRAQRPLLPDFRAAAVALAAERSSVSLSAPPPPTSQPAHRRAPSASTAVSPPQAPSADEVVRLEAIRDKDPLTGLEYDEVQLLWRTREYCCSVPRLLPRFLQATHWGSEQATAEARRLLPRWARFEDPVEALQLLDRRYQDPVVRWYAVTVLDDLSDSRLAMYLLQLVQVLKYEPFHDSPLARFLLRRALRQPIRIGHVFFWLLKSEMHNPAVCELYGLLLAAYVHHCGPHRHKLKRQDMVNDMLQTVADACKLRRKEERLGYVRAELAKLNPLFPSRFTLSLSPRLECKGIVVDKCKIMDSKKLPLWIRFENADKNGDPVMVIFKSGDDLRQDLMTLQILSLMDTLWLDADLDLRMKPYGCVATGDEVGMIEVVTNSATTADIQRSYGGKVLGALRDTPIDTFLHEHNRSEEEHSHAVENFIRSCAGYCVATFVLGIGDRHNDNIMVHEQGALFHIDFGHFLGNFKSKFGVKRERAPFVFTPEMAYVMRDAAGARFAQFESLSCHAFNVLRRWGWLLIDLFILMVPAGMPELTQANDINYLREQLSLHLTDEESEKLFKTEIKHSLGSTSRRVDNWIHNLKHA